AQFVYGLCLFHSFALTPFGTRALRCVRIDHMSLTASEREGPVGSRDGPGRYVALRHDALESMEEGGFASHPVRPELPHFELAQNEGQAADVIQLRMRGHDHIESSNATIPEYRRDHHASPLLAA